MSNEYFVDVVSNASMDLFPENTLSKFVNRLPHALHLNGKWMVAIQEIFYPLAHRAIKRTIDYSISYRGLRKYKKLHFTYSENDSIDSIIDKLNENIATEFVQNVKYKITGAVKPPIFSIQKVKHKDKEKDKVVISFGSIPDTDKPIIPLFNDHHFIRMLGFDPLSLKKDLMDVEATEVIASYQPETGQSTHLMFINSDLIDEHFVGDTSARVLRVVPLDKLKGNSAAHVTFNNPYYYPVRSNYIEDICMLLTDETGQQIKFKTGRIFLSLHFKKIV